MNLLPNINVKKKLITSLTLFLVFSIVGIAAAQEVQRTYTVINPQIAVQLNPGSTNQGTTSIINESNVPLTFSLSVQDYIVQDTKGTPTILPPNTLSNKYSAASWIIVTPTTFTLKPQEKKDIGYFIQVPKDARPGGHYAAIVVTPNTPGQQPTNGTTIQTQIGALFYLTVNGKVNEQAQVTKFTASPSFAEFGPVNILTEIKNLGDLHIQPLGNITVSGLFGNWTYNLAKDNIFPGGVARDYQNTVGQWFMMGPYTAKLAATYGQNNNLTLSATTTFWVFPWRIALIILLIIIAIILGYKYFKKKSSGKAAQQEKAKEETPKTEPSEPQKTAETPTS